MLFNAQHFVRIESRNVLRDSGRLIKCTWIFCHFEEISPYNFPIIYSYSLRSVVVRSASSATVFLVAVIFP